jgi:hypothetical protein
MNLHPSTAQIFGVRRAPRMDAVQWVKPAMIAMLCKGMHGHPTDQRTIFGM